MRAPRRFSGHRLTALLAAALFGVRALTVCGADPARPAVLLSKLSTGAPAAGTLQVEMLRGTLEIHTSDRKGVTLELFSSLGAEPALLAKNIQLTTEGKTVKLRQAGGEPGTWLYRLTVPKNFNLDLRNTEGRIAVTNLEGNVKVWTGSRSIHLGKITGDVAAESVRGAIAVVGASGSTRLKSSGGKLTLGEAGGEAVLETSQGAIKAGIARGPLRAVTSGGGINIGAAFDTVVAETSGGSITAALHRAPAADSRFITSGGSVEIKLPPKAALDLEAGTQNGQVETDLPVRWLGDASKTPRSGKLNGGGRKITARTVAGRVWLQALNDATLPVVAKFEFPVERPVADVRAVPIQAIQRGGGNFIVIPGRPGVYRAGPKVEEGPFIPPGLLLRDGTSFAADIVSVDDTQVVFRKPDGGEESILTSRVAAVILQQIPEKRRAELNRPAAGLLLTSGDFLEGDCRDFSAGQVTMSSVLFGLKKYETKRNARALVFHPLTAPEGK